MPGDRENGNRGRGALGRYDWDAVAGIVAAGGAVVLHLLHIVETEVVLVVIMVVLALLLFRDLRREATDERQLELTEHTATAIDALREATRGPDVILLGPRQLQGASIAFAQSAHGDMVWFNVCLLMFRPQHLFDALLKPALENPNVRSIQFILDHSERERWEADVLPKAEATGHISRLREPRWVPLRTEAVSFILADNATGDTEAHLSFWGEPFMARQPGFDIPRYVFHVQPYSPLVDQLVELALRTRAADA